MNRNQTVKVVTTTKKMGNKSQKKNKSVKNTRPRTVRAPVATSENIRTYFDSTHSSNGNLRVQGCDYISAFSGGNLTTGQVIFNIPISPTSGAFLESRLSNFASNYEKYCFKRLKIHLQSATPTNAQGAVIIGFEKDISDTIADGEQAVRVLSAVQNTRSGSVWNSLTIEVRLTDTQDFYYTNYTGDDPRLTYQGRFLALAQTAIPANCSFTCYMEYDVTFMDPALDIRQGAAVGTLQAYSTQLVPGAINYPAAGLSGIKGVGFKQVSGAAFATPYQGGFESYNSVQPVALEITSGYWSLNFVQRVVALGGNGSYYLYAAAKALIPGAAAAIVKRMATSFITAQAQVVSSTSAGGDKGYVVQNIANGAQVNADLSFGLYIPPGGGIVLPYSLEGINDAASGVSSSTPPVMTLTRISQSQYDNFYEL